MDYYGNDTGYKVLYIPNQGDYADSKDLSFLEEPDDFPVYCTHKITFHRSNKPMPPGNPNFEKIYGKYIDQADHGAEFYDLYYNIINSSVNHKIGGYPCFTQGAPFDGEYEVLLQIGYDDKICFGDAGIASFFILKQDLINLDFSKVQYYWDCS